jgi:hypothetical protein
MKLPLIAVLSAMPLSLAAQPTVSAKSGLISYFEGALFLDDRKVERSLTRFTEIPIDSVVRTEKGRAEVLLGPCTLLRIDENSSFRMLDNRLIEPRIGLLGGSAILDAGPQPKDTIVTLLVKTASVAIRHAGLYRFDFDPPRLKVFTGDADAQRASQNVPVAAGRLLALDAATASEKFDKRALDRLDDWSNARSALLSAQAKRPDRTANDLARAANTAADTEGGIHNPDLVITSGRHAPPPSPFPNGPVAGSNSGCPVSR